MEFVLIYSLIHSFNKVTGLLLCDSLPLKKMGEKKDNNYISVLKNLHSTFSSFLGERQKIFFLKEKLKNKTIVT